MKWKQVSVCALLVVGGALPILGSGFSIFEQAAEPSGLAGAWVARADDAAANWYNPAALVWLEDDQLQIGFNAITVGSNSELTHLERFDLTAITDVLGPVPIAGQTVPATYSTKSSLETPSHLYYVHRPADGIALGIGVNNPYGLVTEWQDAPVTYFAKKSELVTFVVNGNVALRFGDRWAMAFGVSWLDAELESFSRELLNFTPVFGPTGLSLQPVDIGEQNLTGSGDDWGWNVAAHFRGEPWRFGFTYRSRISPVIAGEVALIPDPGVPFPLPPANPGSAVLNLPDQAQIGFGRDLGERWSLEIDLAWAGWSVFDTLEIEIDENFGGQLPDQILREDWDDTMSYRLGVAFASSPANEWRFGVVRDESPVPRETLRPSIPDSDRTGLTVGFGHDSERWTVDLYYMALWFDAITSIPGEPGVLAARYESFTNLGGLTFSARF